MCATSLSPACAAERADMDRLAYDTYVGCQNQYLWHLERDLLTDALRFDLDRCRHLARSVLRFSKKKGSGRYLAFFLLISTDGGESEQNSEAITERRRDVEPFLQEISKVADGGGCVIPGTRLTDPTKLLCAGAGRARERIGLFYSSTK
jgi:hypothetical protein